VERAKVDQRRPVDGQIVDRGVVDVGGEVGAIGGDDGKLRSRDHRLGHGLYAKGGIDRCDAADFDGNVRRFEDAETAAGDFQEIQAGLEMSEHVTAAAVRNAT